MALQFNSSPYYDDYSEDKKFLKILFRPSYPVQARELTQLQTILQNQITRMGDHIFKHGAMVIPGQTSLDLRYRYVKLNPTYNGDDLDDEYLQSFVYSLNGGKEIQGVTSGVRARVINYANIDGDDPATLYVVYVNSGGGVDEGDDNFLKVFLEDEDIIVDGDDDPTATTIDEEATGKGSSTSIQRGIYYVNGYFALVESQTIILDRYTTTPSYRIGLTIEEEIITPEDDTSLLDNAQGSSNFAAPGAHRYKTTLVLDKLELDSVEDQNFIELLRVEDGVIQSKVSTSQYSYLEKTFARRTYDESGNYTVRPFNYEIREHRNNNRGEWADGIVYLAGDVVENDDNTYVAENSATSGVTPPTHTIGTTSDGNVRWRYTESPVFNRGVFQAQEDDGEGDETKFVIAIDPGKAYVQGFEIEKLSVEYVVLDKARDFSRITDGKVSATVGNYILINNVTSVPNIEDLPTIGLYDEMTDTPGAAAGDLVGTAIARGIEYHSGTIGTAEAVYKLFIFNIQMNSNPDKNFNRNVKQVHLDNGFSTEFTADVVGSYFRPEGTVSVTGTDMVGVNTTFLTDYAVGDYTKIAGQDRRVETVTDDFNIVISSALTDDVISVPHDLKLIEILEPENAQSTFKFPFKSIRKIRSADDTSIGTSYTTSRAFEGTSNGSGALTISLSAPGETFASTAVASNYTVIKKSDGTYSAANITVNSSVNITFTGLANTQAYYIIATINKSGSAAQERTKTLSSLTQLDYTTSSEATAKNVSLKQADIYQLIRVQMKPGSFTAIGGGDTLVDITDRYTLDNGQRLTHYDIGSIRLKDNSPVPTGSIRISYYYFTHGAGDYFSVDSYTGVVDYKNIPFILPTTDSSSNYLDFRPRMSWNDTTKVSYFDSAATFPEVPKRGIDVEADYSYYLKRKAKIALSPEGRFFAVDGASSLTPSEPNDPSTGMVLYKLSLAPYTYGANTANVNVSIIDNKRYTMRDIGKLERRIDNLEYYTALSALEQETKSTVILDANGLDRYKNGFIVDNFSGHGIGDVLSPDYRCAIDMENNELRPFYSMKNVSLIEKNTTDLQRSTDGYQITGDLVTLPYTHTSLVQQIFASRTENVNPFMVFSWVGNVELTPSSDEWFETDRRPDIVINVDGNFDTILTQTEASGVLGTVWNAWQTQWTGSPDITKTNIRVSDFIINGKLVQNLDEVNAAIAAGFYLQPTGFSHGETETLIATPTVESRTGFQTSVVPKIDRILLEDRIISTAVIPFMRSTNILFVAKGLKPLTRFFTYFDDIQVDDFVVPATRMAIVVDSGTFTGSISAGGGSSVNARKINGNAQSCLSKGDVITGDSSGATAVVVLVEVDDEGDTFLHLSNVIGTFEEDEDITGSISGATGTVASVPTVKVASDPLVTTANGEVAGIFTIPNSSELHFRTGVREFKLLDTYLNNQNYTSIAKRQFKAQGILETKESTFTSTRNAEIVNSVVSETRNTLKRETFRTVNGNDLVTSAQPNLIEPSDPKNQTPPTPDFMTQINAWIQNAQERIASTTETEEDKKFSRICYGVDPLAQTIKINQRGGAFLTKLDLYFQSKDTNLPVTVEIRETINGYPGPAVLPFSKVSLTPDKVNISEDASEVTTFTFPSPVYVLDDTEYCIVVLADSTEYNVWISQLGEKMVDSDRFISEQPYGGSLFKSQNASTWTADQLQDLKFNLYRATFNTDVTGNITFKNNVPPIVSLTENPFTTTSGTNSIRVFQRNHGFVAGSLVTIAGAVDTNGISDDYLNGSHEVLTPELDSYILQIVDGSAVAQNATSSGPGGGDSITATNNIRYDSLQINAQLQNFSDTRLSFTTEGISVGYVEDSSSSTILPNTTHSFAASKVIATPENETEFSIDDSLLITGSLYSTNNSLSPVIDLHRLSVIAINNKIDNPTSSLNIANLDSRTVLAANATIAFDSTYDIVSTTNAAAKLAFKTLSVGKYITITGAANGGNNSTFLITKVASDGSYFSVDGALTTEAAGSSVTLVSKERFVDEIATIGGSAFSKYITKKINLQNESTGLRIHMAVNLPAGATIEVYQKSGKSETYDTANFSLIDPDETLPVLNNYNEFSEITYTLSDIDAFTSLATKIVMKSSETAAVPRIKDLRIIALA